MTVTLTASVKAERILFRLPTMRKNPRHSTEFKKTVLSATPRYATQCEIQVKNFLVDSPLCGIARSRVSSSNLIEYLREVESICKTVLAHESGDPGVQFNEKNRGSKISGVCPLKFLPCQKLNTTYDEVLYFVGTLANSTLQVQNYKKITFQIFTKRSSVELRRLL
jgi:hypothetical protein